MSTLTERQRREQEYYDEYSRRAALEDVDFAPILGEERRSWNSYWYTFEQVRDAYVHGGARVALDFGCGSGVGALRCARLGYEAHGFDISPAAIEQAKALARKYGLEECTHFTVQTAEAMDYASECFDVIVGTDILHHVEIGPAIRECHRILKPGGIAVFREHVEAPLFEPLRNSRLGLWLVPKEKSFEHHTTEDERKLNERDLQTIREVFPAMRVARSRVLSRISRFLPATAAALQRLDHRLVQAFPAAGRLGGAVVMALTKT